MRHLKRITILTMVLAFLISGTVFAADTADTQSYDKIENVKITIGYDSFFYNAKIFFEKIRITNAFTQAGKANVAGIFAKRRMAEAHLMIEKGDIVSAKQLIQSGLDYITFATEHVSSAVLEKDNGRSRLVLANVSQIQSDTLRYLKEFQENNPDSFFDPEQMISILKEDIIDVMVLWTYLSYKENLMDNTEMRQSAQASFESAQAIGPDAITSATLNQLEEFGVVLTADEIDAITSATYDLMIDEGVPPPAGTDATTSATIALDAGTTGTTIGGTTPSGGVDATSSATTITSGGGTTGGGTTTSGGGTTGGTTSGGGVDATSSATTTVSGGGTTSPQGTVSYEDEHDDHEDEHEEDDDD